MNRHLKSPCLYKNIRYSLLMLGLFSLPSYAAEPLEKVVMDVVINGHNEGQQVLSLDEENGLVVLKKLLKSLHIKESVYAAIPGDSVYLNQLPDLTFNMDSSTAVLNLTVPMEWFEDQAIRQGSNTIVASRKIVELEPASAYINYQVQNSFSDAKGLETVNVPLEVGINVGQWFSSSSFAINYTNTAEHKLNLQRQMTSLTWDDIANKRSLVLGDFNPPTQALMSSNTLGGISWGTKFSVDRQFRAYPNLDVEAMVASASHAQLISNGQVVKEWDVAPGRVLFSDLGSYAGSSAVLVLTDAYGGQRRLSIPTFTSSQLLKADLHEYNYSLGFIKNQSYLFDNFSYAHPLFSGYHRYGVTNNVTVGLGVALDGHKMITTPSINTAMGENTKLTLAGSTVWGKKENFYAASTNYQYNWQNLFSYAAFNFFGRGYDNTFTANSFNNFTPDALVQRYQTTVGIGYNENDLGSLNANYSESVVKNQKTERFVSLNYQKQLFSGLIFNLSARDNVELIKDYSILFGLRYYPSEPEQRDFYNAVNYQLAKTNQQPMQQELTVQKYNNRGLGFGYNVALKNDSDKDNAYGDVRTQYNHEKAILTTNYSRSKTNDTRGGFAIAGSVTAIDGGIYAARPISDSFALVKTGRENTPIELYNTINGYTNEQGELLVPELTSYIDNKVDVPANTLTINETVDHNEQYVTTKQRGSGSIVSFAIQKFTAVEGNIRLLTADNKIEKLESVPVEVMINDKKYESYLGAEGYFYLENIPNGEHTLTVLLYQGNCSTPVKVTKSVKLVQNLGTLTCKVNSVSATAQPIENKVVQEKTATPVAKPVSEQPNAVSENLPNAALQNEKPYTIQIMASENQVEMTRLVDKYKSSVPLTVSTKLKNGKKLFVLIYGAYETPEEAKDALKSVPPELKQNNPWIIKVGNP